MLRDKQRELSPSLLSLFIITITIISMPVQAELSSLAKNDALPMFTTLNLDDALLLTRDQLLYKDVDWAEKKHNHVGLSISPFAQSADRGKTIKGQTGCPVITNSCGATLTDTPLGDLTGRTGMIALLMGAFPQCAGGNYPGGEDGALSTAYNNLFCTSPDEPDTCTGTPGTLSIEGDIDPNQLFGYFSFPLKYRKRGVRFEFDGRFYNFGFRLQTGVSTIRQVREETINTTSLSQNFTPVTSTITAPKVNTYLMNEFDTIAKEIGIDICDFVETSMEEVRCNLFWRQAFEVNQDAENDWARFLVIPYVEAAVSASPGKQFNHQKFFGAAFGNNTHTSCGFTTGINLDFLETIEIGGEVGYTHFFKKNFDNMPIPTSKFQTNMFPFSTNVSVQPGDNWHFGARIAAYHFIDNLSMYFEWFVLDHQQDSICLECPDPAFLPEVLECTTSFKTKVGNAGFNYDLAPNIGVGFLWQIPFSQRNSYRSSTLMAGFNVTF